ncbi:TetR family transcriptional regulator [Paractinoplanes abujensis]|uniref:AcrR family transcriptional regulator n=1 Tax=Paractinoplanes abujensis TaxID=882441 RepID=A0A7W7CM78_9ACTN|nr:TetR-like C-terminal domain-containing protein [Actinoplanes abujensis]MBB4691082.1 AcrR family transcriptional regulator [Actinoplanes abujensis]GID17505.1 TetR family transcriptional regulator [Actinoplanes abujensis]
MATKRDTYHHGDLRAALIDAGITLARTGGPQAVVLREVTRIVGVAPNSAYGHFATLTALKSAVAERARVDMAVAMGAELEAAEPLAYLRAVGRAYVRYALTEPGLFRTAMGGDPTGLRSPAEFTAAEEQLKPRHHLVAALAGLVEAGHLPPDKTGKAALACWATVHGLSIMLLDLLPQMGPAEQDAAVDDALDVLLAGLASL